GGSVRVAVVGGGPGGLAAARELARLGHAVELFDERRYPGGDLALAARLPEYPEYHRIVDWYAMELVDLNVVCHTGIDVDLAAPAAALGPGWDAVVLATGGRGPEPALPGSDTRRVRDVRDFLRTESPAPEEITMFGADREAAAVADALLAAGTRVTMIGPQPGIAHDVGRRGKIVLVPRLLAHPCLTLHLESVITAIEAHRVRIRPLDPGAPERWIPGGGELLVSQGITPRTELQNALRTLEPPLGVHAVGDASGDGGSIHAAITTAIEAAGRIHAAAHRSTQEARE
ncbi:FAD-dependent oxidoreductase, partial [Tsukamurella soli]|uniref:FAD-dependent oxidoreductase n=1 Tax=Tsukamurella soli TaxID=644556 RepID=UPI0031EDDA46